MSYDVECWVGRVPADAHEAEAIYDELVEREEPPPAALLAFAAAVRAEAPDSVAAMDAADGPWPPWAMSGTLDPEGWVVEIVMTFDGVERGERVIRRAAAAHGITVWDPQTETCWVEGGAPPPPAADEPAPTRPVAPDTVALWIGRRPDSPRAAHDEFMRRQDGAVEASLEDEDALDGLLAAMRRDRLVDAVPVSPRTGLGAYTVAVLREGVDRARLHSLVAEHGGTGLDLSSGRAL